MSSPEANRPEGGPLERSHLKDMIQRNALESAAYFKLAKHLENQKKAFVRQNTRDEGEMKNLLCRLQMEQLNSLGDAEDKLDGDIERTSNGINRGTESLYSEPLEPDCVANPYPITIIPRFGGTPYIKQPVVTRGVVRRPGSTSGSFRRKSVEYEDIQESLSTMNISNLCSFSETGKTSPTSIKNMSHDEHLSRDWLATPGAISSIRRMRKSVTEQTQLRIRRQSGTDHYAEFLTLSSSCPPSVAHSRSNSLKDKKKSKDADPTSPRTGINRRGTSLKERKTSHDHVLKSSLSRSSSMLSNASRSENIRKLDRKPSKKETEVLDEGNKIKRKNSRKSEKQTVPPNRKLSSDSAPFADSDSPRRASSVRQRPIEVTSVHSTPTTSPLAKEIETFIF